MFTLLSAVLFSSGLFPSFMNSPAVSVGRAGSNNAYVEVCSGVAVSSSHVVTLFAFTRDSDVFLIEKGNRLYPDSVVNFRDMGLSMLFFEEDVFTSYEQPRCTHPANGAALMIIADHPTGLSVVRTFPMEQLSDGALLLASPPTSELMGAPVFDAYDRLSGIITGSFDPGDGRGELMAMIPCDLWYFWVETVLSDAGMNTPLFGITAMPATSGLSAVQGILVLDVEDGSPAEDCGLMKGDIITMINGTEVYHPEALRVMVQNSTEELTVTLQRDMETTEIVIPSLQQQGY
ncbi:MAG: PDZ domain-containing protein [Candidatus Fermentibacteraceae bacterium]|nr:PDZ domain-containing protein [Candidatus Fermentibacteraceae bacterium]